MREFRGVLFPEAVRRWDEIEPLLVPALEGSDGCYDADSILELIGRQSVQLWASVNEDRIEAVLVTIITIFPRRKVLSVPFIGGKEMRRWFPTALQTIEAYGKYHGCTLLTGGWRKGWARLIGGRISGVSIVKDI